MSFQNWNINPKDKANTSMLGSFTVKLPREKNYNFLKFGEKSQKEPAPLGKIFGGQDRTAEGQPAFPAAPNPDMQQTHQQAQEPHVNAPEGDPMVIEEPQANTLPEMRVQPQIAQPMPKELPNSTLMLPTKIPLLLDVTIDQVQDIELTLANVNRESIDLEDVSQMNERMARDLTMLRQQFDDMKRMLAPMKDEIINLNVRATMLSNEVLAETIPLFATMMKPDLKAN